jgi:hypothetical protein
MAGGRSRNCVDWLLQPNPPRFQLPYTRQPNDIPYTPEEILKFALFFLDNRVFARTRMKRKSLEIY